MTPLAYVQFDMLFVIVYSDLNKCISNAALQNGNNLAPNNQPTQGKVQESYSMFNLLPVQINEAKPEKFEAMTTNVWIAPERHVFQYIMNKSCNCWHTNDPERQ